MDSEGFSERPQTIDEITRAQREAAGYDHYPLKALRTVINNFHYSSDEQAMNLTIRDQPIFEDESQAKQAMDDMANTLRMVGACIMDVLIHC